MQAKTKNSPVPRAVVEAFYRALANRHMKTIAGYLDDAVTWTISGPVDILPFCGRRVGKAVVMKLLDRDIPTFLTGRRFIPNTMLVDGDSAAVLGKLMATLRDGGRVISYRIAHFIRSGTTRWSNIIRSSTASTQPNRCSAIRLTCMTTIRSTGVVWSRSSVGQTASDERD